MWLKKAYNFYVIQQTWWDSKLRFLKVSNFFGIQQKPTLGRSLQSTDFDLVGRFETECFWSSG